MIGQAQDVLTIGHSTHSVETFVRLLQMHGVTLVADVRSAPYSHLHPQFDRDKLAASLKAHGIAYAFLGHHLGGRPDDRSCYENGRVQYARLARSCSFREGIERVVRGASRHRIALMCAEKEPLECHRAILVSPALIARGLRVEHILADGSLEPHEATMERLLRQLRLPDQDLFRSKEEIIAEALERQGERIAYVDKDLELQVAKRIS